MSRTKKKTIKIKAIAICLAILMIASVTATIFNVVLAEGTSAIQISGMSSIGTDGYASYKAMTGPADQEAGRMIGISVREGEGFSGINGDMGTMINDASGNKYTYSALPAGTYTFKVEVYTGYTLNNVTIREAGEQNGTEVTLTPVPETNNQFTFEVLVAEGKTMLVNPSFSYNGGGTPPPPSEDPNQGGGHTQITSDIRIWVDGNSEAVIDPTANPPKTVYNGNGFTINKDLFHADYDIAISSGKTIPAIRVEGTGAISITPGSDIEKNESNNFGANVAPSTIMANAEGYSIFSENNESRIHVETMQAMGAGNVILNGGVNIGGSFGVSDHDLQIGSEAVPSVKGIRANNVVVEYGQLKMYCSDKLFDGTSPENKMNIDVLTQGKIVANTTLSTGTAVNNLGKLTVMCDGDVLITNRAGSSLGTVNKCVRYYDFVNFETTQVVEEAKDVKEIPAVGTGDGKYYSMEETATLLHLKSLSKPLYTLSFNMTDENGDIIEDTKVAHGTVKIKTACGIGRGADGRTCNDFKIEQGTPVTIELLPDYGYQFTSGSLNGAAITTAQEGIATYQFNMPANHLHLSAIFTRVEDSIVINNDEIVGASIGNLEGQINGNAEFKVETAENVDKDKFNAAIDEGTIAGFANLSLNQVVLKGNETDAWKTGITDLQQPMSVSLEVSDDMAEELEKGKSVGVLRDHNGEISLMEATYNADTKKLEFNTDGYSTYAIVYSATELKAKSATTDNKTDIVKTGDVVLLVAIPTIILVIIANVIVTNNRKRTTRRK